MAIATGRILSDELLVRCAERAPVYDRENRFFQEDFDELREAGYLCMNVPTELGVSACHLPRCVMSSAAWHTTPRPRPWR